jgi:uncharacterized protein involved in type VI secretion and phage assembly
MMEVIANAMRLQAQRSTAQLVVTRVALVASYDPSTYRAKVTLQPEGQTTGWLPIAAVWVGPSWGLFAPPIIDQQVNVTFVEGELNSGFVENRFFNLTETPLAVQSGELWIVHANGQFGKWTNDGKLTFGDGQGAQVQFDGSGNLVSAAKQWTHTGSVSIDGDVDVTGTVAATEDVTAGTADISLVGHNHPVIGIETGTSDINTNSPNP